MTFQWTLVGLLLVCLLGFIKQGYCNVASPTSARVDWDDYGLDDIAIIGEINHSIETAKHWIHQQEDHHSRHVRSAGLIGRRDPYSLIQKFGFTKDASKILGRAARVIENVTQIYGVERLKSLSKRQISDLCVEAGFTITSRDCPISLKYRTSDGSCNNLLNVNWGKSFTPFSRELPPIYSDGVSEPRLAVSNKPLPSARTTAGKSIHFIHIFEDSYTTLVMNIGQYLDHDIDHSSTEDEDCKHCRRTAKCLPITVPPDDDFFHEPCIPFARSVPVPSPDCEPGPRQHVNQVTSYLDLSSLYGSTQEEMDELRDTPKRRGLLKTSPSPRGQHAHPHLPHDEEHEDCFILRAEEKCGQSGDARAAEQPGLTCMHTLFMRQHNQVANELSFINPHWSDEILFQETRRIMIGIWQHIVYNEYLPALLGSKRTPEEVRKIKREMGWLDVLMQCSTKRCLIVDVMGSANVQNST